MFLKNENLLIRNATAADAQQLAAWWNDGNVMAHAGFPNGLGITAEEIAASLAKDTDEHRRHIIEENGVAIGEMNYRSKGNGIAEMVLSQNLCKRTSWCKMKSEARRRAEYLLAVLCA